MANMLVSFESANDLDELRMILIEGLNSIESEEDKIPKDMAGKAMVLSYDCMRSLLDLIDTK